MGRSACRGESGLWEPVGSAVKKSEVVTIDALGHRSASASCMKVARPYHVCTHKEYLDLGLCLIYRVTDIPTDARQTETAGFPLSETFA